MTPDARRPPETAARRSPDGPDDSSTPALLMAEPDEELAKQAMARFSAAGVSVIACHDGAEALLQVGAQHPGAVLLGAPLPVVNAADVTRLINRLSPVPVIVGAGPDGTEEATAALAAGAVAFVARPYRIEEILPSSQQDSHRTTRRPQRWSSVTSSLIPSGFTSTYEDARSSCRSVNSCCCATSCRTSTGSSPGRS